MNWTAEVRQYSSFVFFCQISKRSILAINIGVTKPRVDDITCFHLDMDTFVKVWQLHQVLMMLEMFMAIPSIGKQCDDEFSILIM
jgi:hypothetical protein